MIIYSFYYIYIYVIFYIVLEDVLMDSFEYQFHQKREIKTYKIFIEILVLFDVARLYITKFQRDKIMERE